MDYKKKEECTQQRTVEIILKKTKNEEYRLVKAVVEIRYRVLTSIIIISYHHTFIIAQKKKYKKKQE